LIRFDFIPAPYRNTVSYVISMRDPVSSFSSVPGNGTVLEHTVLVLVLVPTAILIPYGFVVSGTIVYHAKHTHKLRHRHTHNAIAEYMEQNNGIGRRGTGT